MYYAVIFTLRHLKTVTIYFNDKSLTVTISSQYSNTAFNKCSLLSVFIIKSNLTRRFYYHKLILTINRLAIFVITCK